MTKRVITFLLIICVCLPLIGCVKNNADFSSGSSISTNFSSYDKTTSDVTSEASSDVISKNTTSTVTSEYLNSTEISSENLSNFVTKSLRDLEVGESLDNELNLLENIGFDIKTSITFMESVDMLTKHLVANGIEINKHKFMHASNDKIDDIVYFVVREYVDIDEYSIATLNWYYVDSENGYLYINNLIGPAFTRLS